MVYWLSVVFKGLNLWSVTGMVCIYVCGLELVVSVLELSTGLPWSGAVLSNHFATVGHRRNLEAAGLTSKLKCNNKN